MTVATGIQWPERWNNLPTNATWSQRCKNKTTWERKGKFTTGKIPEVNGVCLNIITALHICAKFSATSVPVGKYCGQLK